MFDFNKWLKETRTEAGLTQEQVAKKSYFSIMTIQNLEAGRRIGNIETMNRIMDALGYEIKVVRKDGNKADN